MRTPVGGYENKNENRVIVDKARKKNFKNRGLTREPQRGGKLLLRYYRLRWWRKVAGRRRYNYRLGETIGSLRRSRNLIDSPCDGLVHARLFKITPLEIA